MRQELISFNVLLRCTTFGSFLRSLNSEFQAFE